MSDTQKKDRGAFRHRAFSILGIVLCVILIPTLIINCTLLIKSKTNPDQVPSFLGLVPLIVLTDSMHDDFPAGSLIISQHVDAEDVEIGDVISFFDPESKTDAIVTHKVVEIEKDANGKVTAFRTKGTANNTQDRLAVPIDNLVGRYTGFHIRGMGSLAMFMQTTVGFIVCVFVPLFALVSYDVIRRRLYEKQNNQDKDELMKELEELRRLKEQQDQQNNQDQQE